MAKEQKTQDIVIYRGPKGAVSLRAQFEKETLWATLDQIAKLFGRDKSVVSRHIKNILTEGELRRDSVVAKIATTANDGKVYQVDYYNLDMVISVGYRVNSAAATKFRQWATETLRDYLLHGYVLSHQRLIESKQNTLKDLEKTIGLIQSVVSRKYLKQDEVSKLFDVVKEYAHSWLLLNEYDEGSVSLQQGSKKSGRVLSYEKARHAIDTLRVSLVKKGEASDLFGNERDGTFSGIVQTIYQTFGGKELYVSLEEKAAHLLYFIIKDHPFSDGNKRIAALLFMVFLENNSIARRKNGERKINDNTLVALALLVAESDPKEKEQIVALITQLIR